MYTYLRTAWAARTARRDERGASAVEYGLLVAGIAAIIVLVVFALGGNIRDAFQDTSNCVDDNAQTECEEDDAPADPPGNE